MNAQTRQPYDNEFRALLIFIVFAVIAITVSSLIAMGEQFVTGQTFRFWEGWNSDSGYFGISMILFCVLWIWGTKITTKKT